MRKTEVALTSFRFADQQHVGVLIVGANDALQLLPLDVHDEQLFGRHGDVQRHEDVLRSWLAKVHPTAVLRRVRWQHRTDAQHGQLQGDVKVEALSQLIGGGVLRLAQRVAACVHPVDGHAGVASEPEHQWDLVLLPDGRVAGNLNVGARYGGYFGDACRREKKKKKKKIRSLAVTIYWEGSQSGRQAALSTSSHSVVHSIDNLSFVRYPRFWYIA